MTSQRFLGLPDRLPEGETPRAVLFSAGHGTSYPGQDSSSYALAAEAIRAASQADAPLIAHWDFDLGGPLFQDRPISCIDQGEIATAAHANARNRAAITAKTEEILALPAVPILLGGDDSVVIPFLEGFAKAEPIWIVQIDAHLDWRDEVKGERFGYSSPMRRASEMAHIAGMVQLGLRGVGSARRGEVEDARNFGSRLVTAREIHEHGIHTAVRHVPDGARIVITLDCDALDPSIMPGVAARTPGGLTYLQVIDLIAALGQRGRIAGFDMVELYPKKDLDGLSALTASRILVNLIGAICRQA
ncbi:agmatinase [Xaviernesmea oryzae]|uniref:Agmatinase n=1 Tax=Xaviernesmea oryzae TaxID=464029 RepID=A0A1Q9B0I5_9HYPH|nr:arginase family protein [Xaviernesmea oryzae]OLP61483.1 agmatinase [Xaviernesmea oryzae]SEL67899.1 agmatinase [Xaviernesmea oryzae]